VFTFKKRMMPESHGFLPGNFDLVSEHLPIALIITPDLNTRISFVPTKLETERKISGLAAAPDQPIPFHGGAGAPNLAIADFPCARLTVPTIEIGSIEQLDETGFVDSM
jgi:hypothetical protein